MTAPTATHRQVEVELYAPQARAIAKIIDPARRIDTLMAAGTGGGKTYSLVVASTLLASMNPPGVNGMLVSPTDQMLEDVLLPELEAFWDKHGISYRLVGGEGRRRCYMPQFGNWILLRSGDRPNRLRGKTIAWAGLDEASYMSRAEQVLQECYKRCRHPQARKRVIFAATTPNGFDAMYYWAVAPGRATEGDTDYVQWSSSENLAVLGADPQYVERMRRLYSADVYAQEAEAQFLVVGAGRTFHAFSRQQNLRAYDLDPSKPLDLCVDFNVDPCGWVISQGPGTYNDPDRAIDEITVAGDRATYLALAEFQERYPQHAQGQGVRIFGDATGHNRKTTGRSDFQVLQQALPQAEVYVRAKNPAEKDRVNATNSLLCDANGVVRGYVHPDRCPELITDLEQTRNVQGTSHIDKARDAKRTHWSDAWSYKHQALNPVHAQNASEIVRRSRQTPASALYDNWLSQG